MEVTDAAKQLQSLLANGVGGNVPQTGMVMPMMDATKGVLPPVTPDFTANPQLAMMMGLSGMPGVGAMPGMDMQQMMAQMMAMQQMQQMQMQPTAAAPQPAAAAAPEAAPAAPAESPVEPPEPADGKKTGLNTAAKPFEPKGFAEESPAAADLLPTSNNSTPRIAAVSQVAAEAEEGDSPPLMEDSEDDDDDDDDEVVVLKPSCPQSQTPEPDLHQQLQQQQLAAAAAAPAPVDPPPQASHPLLAPEDTQSQESDTEFRPMGMHLRQAADLLPVSEEARLSPPPPPSDAPPADDATLSPGSISIPADEEELIELPAKPDGVAGMDPTDAAAILAQQAQQLQNIQNLQNLNAQMMHSFGGMMMGGINPMAAMLPMAGMGMALPVQPMVQDSSLVQLPNGVLALMPQTAPFAVGGGGFLPQPVPEQTQAQPMQQSGKAQKKTEKNVMDFFGTKPGSTATARGTIPVPVQPLPQPKTSKASTDKLPLPPRAPQPPQAVKEPVPPMSVADSAEYDMLNAMKLPDMTAEQKVRFRELTRERTARKVAADRFLRAEEEELDEDGQKKKRQPGEPSPPGEGRRARRRKYRLQKEAEEAAAAAGEPIPATDSGRVSPASREDDAPRLPVPPTQPSEERRDDDFFGLMFKNVTNRAGGSGNSSPTASVPDTAVLDRFLQNNQDITLKSQPSSHGLI